MRLKPGLGLGVLCALLILSACRPATGWRWERAEAGLPHEAVVLALVADPADPSRIWAGYYAPGGLASSRDGGRTWTTGAAGLNDNPVFDLLLLPDGLLWAATRDGLLQSRDGGASWGPVTAGLPSAAAFAIAADGAGRVYVGLDDGGLYVEQAGTWASLAPGMAILSLAVSHDGRNLYAGTAGHGLLASRDAGRTWSVAFEGDFAPNLALNPSRPTQAVASLRDRLVRTVDAGESWQLLTIPWPEDKTVSLLWSAGGTLWAGSSKGRVYCSQDGGTSWVEGPAGLPGDEGVLALAGAGDRLLAGTWTGVYASPVPGGCDNAQQKWAYLAPSLGVPHANALLAADAGLLIGTRSGLFRWQPAAQRWTPLAGTGFRPRGITALATSPADGHLVYAGTAAGDLFRSQNGGVSWARVPSERAIGIRSLAVAPGGGDHLYMVASWERAYESTNGGQRWKGRWTGLGVTTEAISLAIDPVDPTTLYLGADTGLYRSRYGGEDWRLVGRALDDQSVLTVVARPAPDDGARGSILYIGATRGAYRSQDGGDTLQVWGRGLEDLSVTALLFAPNDPLIVYAGTAYAGLYQSVDGGEVWQPIGPVDLSGEVVEAMAWGPAGELFVAAAGGVWVGTK